MGRGADGRTIGRQRPVTRSGQPDGGFRRQHLYGAAGHPHVLVHAQHPCPVKRDTLVTRTRCLIRFSIHTTNKTTRPLPSTYTPKPEEPIKGVGGLTHQHPHSHRAVYLTASCNDGRPAADSSLPRAPWWGARRGQRTAHWAVRYLTAPLMTPLITHFWAKT